MMEVVNLSPQIGNVGMLQATLATPDGQRLHVFVVHLDPFAATTRVDEIARLNQVMAPYLHEPTILMGDMNFYCLNEPETCQEYQALSGAGWRLVMNGKYLIDQIWTSPHLSESATEITFSGASFDISDHLPVGATIFSTD
jgi:endonuclease/exonuclease/phosphatase family metal-dependent hydrolase